MIIYSYHLRIKLSIFCLSVKSPSCSRSLVIHKIRSALDNNVLRSENSFLTLRLYIFTYRRNWKNWSTVSSFLAFLNAVLGGSCSATFPSLNLLKRAYRMSRKAYSLYFQDDGSFTFLSIVTHKPGSDITPPILLSQCSVARLLTLY